MQTGLLTIKKVKHDYSTAVIRYLETVYEGGNGEKGRTATLRYVA